MTRKEHYQKAERLLVDAWVVPEDREPVNRRMTREQLISVAQVHATLALASDVSA